MGSIKETILFSRLKRKDREAFAVAYDEYSDSIYRFVYFKIGDVEEAKDLTSAIFLKVWGFVQNNGIRDYKTLKSLIYKVARNCVVDYYRKNAMENAKTVDISELDKQHVVSEKDDLLLQTVVLADIEMVQQKMLDLKDEYREIIILRYIEELSVGEVADILEKSVGNVRILTYRALKALREIITNDH